MLLKIINVFPTSNKRRYQFPMVASQSNLVELNWDDKDFNCYIFEIVKYRLI